MPNSSFIDNYEVKEENGAKWVKIFYHCSKNLDFFKDEKEALLSLNNENKYSILKYLPYIKRYEARKYEFLIEYPEYTGFNRWKQTSNPLKSKKVSGFEYNKGDIAWSTYFDGLAKYSGSTLLGGCPNKGWWHFAIGAYTNYTAIDKFPGPAACGWLPKEVRLWIRIASFSNIICFDICTYRIRSRRSFLKELLFCFLLYS